MMFNTHSHEVASVLNRCTRPDCDKSLFFLTSAWGEVGEKTPEQQDE